MMLNIPTTPPHVSVNRVRIIDLPGLPLDNEVRGRRADHLLSNTAITRYARERAAALRLPRAYLEDSKRTRVELARFVDSCLSSDDTKACIAAQDIGRRLGRNLGYILLTLHRGDEANRAARPDWHDTDWERWAKIKKVWVGGGVMNGELGELIVQHARALLAELGYGAVLEVEITPYKDAMTILGAARYLPATTRYAVCLDCGHTAVKRTCVELVNGAVARLRRYAPVSVEWDLRNLPASGRDLGMEVLNFVADAIVQTMQECAAEGIAPDENVMLSVAAYVRDGKLLGNGLYANISELAADTRPLLSDAVSACIERAVQVHSIHDGTAACAVHAGARDTAVLVIGTAIGVGFPPSEERGLRPLAW